MRLLNHIYEISVKFKSLCLLPELARTLSGKLKEEALKMVVRIGTGKILKAMEKIYSHRREFRDIIIPESINQFKQLKERNDSIDEEPQEKVKRMVSPLFMCLLHRSDLFLHLIHGYDKLVPHAKSLVLEKFSAILKSILQPNEVTGLYFEALIIQRESSDKKEDYKPLIEAFRKYIKIKGGKVQSIFSEAIVDFSLKSGNIQILGEFKEDLMVEKLIKILIHRGKQQTFSFKDIKELADIAGLTIHKMLVEVIFYSDQNEDTIPILTALEGMIMTQIDLKDLSKNDFKMLLLHRLNNIMPNKQNITKETKPVPILFFPFLLKIIALLQKQAEVTQPWEVFLELVILLIRGDQQKENVVWQGLVRFCKFDKKMAEQKIIPLMPSEDRERLYQELF